MLAKGKEIVTYLEELAPLEYAIGNDPTGLQWGDLERSVGVLLLALDFTGDVLQEAVEKQASFILTHHPYLYRPLSRLNIHHTHEGLVVKALKKDITLYAAHTNLDVSPRGVNQVLGELLELRQMKPLAGLAGEGLEKLVVFVPQGYEDSVRDALAAAGAGFIGNYSNCTFLVLGTGTFLPRQGSSPFLGTKGALEKVAEYRLETVLPRNRRAAVLKALFQAHPYEEVAYDLYPLAGAGETLGLGRAGLLPQKMTLRALAGKVQKLLQSPSLKITGDPEMPVDKVALLGGSGGGYLDHALLSGAQVFLTGDIGYHDAQKAAAAGLALIDAGHDCTEKPVLHFLAGYLQNKLEQGGFKTRVMLSRTPICWWSV